MHCPRETASNSTRSSPWQYASRFLMVGSYLLLCFCSRLEGGDAQFFKKIVQFFEDCVSSIREVIDRRSRILGSIRCAFHHQRHPFVAAVTVSENKRGHPLQL